MWLCVAISRTLKWLPPLTRPIALLQEDAICRVRATPAGTEQRSGAPRRPGSLSGSADHRDLCSFSTEWGLSARGRRRVPAWVPGPSLALRRVDHLERCVAVEMLEHRAGQLVQLLG